MAATLDAAHVESGSVAALKQQLQHSQQLVKDPPPIPQVTDNFIPLKTIISSMVYYAHSELRNILETLPSTTSDLTKKRRLLDYIVKIRVQFVKVYVLTKWAKVSSDISKTIDVVSWLNGQQNCFHNVIGALVQIEKSLGGAKVRNPDIETALEVFTAGRPAHPSRTFAPAKTLLPTTMLQTLHDLNILLSIRLALTEKLPPEFSHYQIANGRVTFFVENSYQVQLGIADDSVDARFFLIDFQFDFPGAHVLSSGTRAKMETLANNILLSKGLISLFDMLLKFSQNYKLSMFHKELTELSRGLYSGLIAPKFYPDKSLVTVHYWLSPSRNNTSARNMIEIGLQRTKKIGIRWHREGKVVQDHGIEFGQTNISTEWLLQEIATLHVRHNITSVYNCLCNFWGKSGRAAGADKKLNQQPTNIQKHSTSPKNTPDQQNPSSSALSNSPASISNAPASSNTNSANDLVTLCSPEKIKLKLTDSRFTIYSIDRLTGRAILKNSTKLIGSVEAALNDVSDKPQYVAELLIKLRHVSLQDEISARAKSAGWITKTNLPFSGDVIRSRFPHDTKLVFCMRQAQWPKSWFLLVTIGAGSQPQWWISQLIMKDGVWLVTFSEEVRLNRDNITHYDYRMFKELSIFTIGRIQTEALCKELDQSNIKYKLLQVSTNSLHESGPPVILLSMQSLCQGSWAEQTVFLRLLNNEPDVTTAVLQGRAKHSLDIGSMSNSDPGVSFDPASGVFTLNLTLPNSCMASPAYLSGNFTPARKLEPQRSEFVELLVGKFSQIERIVSYVNLLKSLSLELREASMTKMTFEYGPSMLASIILDSAPDSSHSSQSLSETAVLKLHENSPHHFVEPFLQSMLNTDGLLSVVWVLQTALPLYVALQEIMELAVSSTVTGNNLLASVPVIVTPHSIFDIQLYFPAKRMRIQLRLMETNGRPLSVYVTELLQIGGQPSLSGPATTQQPPRSSLLTPLWTEKSDIPGVVPLMQGLASPIANIGQVLHKIFDILVNQ